jgi:hypothetical protein
VGSGARLGLGGVQDPVACFAQDEVGEGGNKVFPVDMVGLQPKLGHGLGLGREDEQRNEGDKNMGSPLEECRYRRMM